MSRFSSRSGSGWEQVLRQAFQMTPPPKAGDLTLTKLSGACGAVTSQRTLLESDKIWWAGLVAKGFPAFTAELQSAACRLGNRVFTPHRLPHAHRSARCMHFFTVAAR